MQAIIDGDAGNRDGQGQRLLSVQVKWRVAQHARDARQKGSN